MPKIRFKKQMQTTVGLVSADHEEVLSPSGSSSVPYCRTLDPIP